MSAETIQVIQLLGAGGFGAIIGWYVYFVNRYRRTEVQIGDVVTIVGAIGGAAVIALYKPDTVLFGAYGIGLFLGFFGYFATLWFLVRSSENFTTDWFLDGRRRNPPEGYGYGNAVGTPGDSGRAMSPFSMAEAAPGNMQREAGTKTVMHFHGVDAANFAEKAFRTTESFPTEATNEESVRIIAACKSAWNEPSARGACNVFVTAVAGKFGITITGMADKIVGDLAKDPAWEVVSDGVAARAAAEKGLLVVAGIKSTDYSPPRAHGHLAIVTEGPMNPSGWAPAGYWGSLDSDIASKGGSGAPISLCFSQSIKDKIIYRARKI